MAPLQHQERTVHRLVRTGRRIESAGGDRSRSDEGARPSAPGAGAGRQCKESHRRAEFDGPRFAVEAVLSSRFSVLSFQDSAVFLRTENRELRTLSFMFQFSPWIPAVLMAMGAGVLDWRHRRIPNWLTVSGLIGGIGVNIGVSGWAGARASLLGAALGLGLLLPFVLLRSLGAGDWKLAGALGACLGPGQLVSVLMGTILVAGVIALALVIWKGRFIQTLRNIVRL